MIKIKDGFRGSRAIILPASVVADMERHFFQSKLYITDMGYYPKAFHHFRRRENGAAQYILIYCMSGRGWLELHGRTCTISENQFFIIPRDTPHAYGSHSRDPWSIYWIHFNGEMAPSYAEGRDIPTRVDPSDKSRVTERTALFEEIYATLEKGYGKENLHYVTSCLHYYLGSLTRSGESGEPPGSPQHGRDVTERAIFYMRESIEKRVTLAELCIYLGYSVSYVSTIFKRHTGYSPMGYMNRLRIQAACKLLDFTDMKINQICHKVGISDPYHFSKLFAKTTGFSPSRYRAMKKG